MKALDWRGHGHRHLTGRTKAAGEVVSIPSNLKQSRRSFFTRKSTREGLSRRVILVGAFLVIARDLVVKHFGSAVPSVQTGALPLCTREQIQNGRWERVLLDKAPYKPDIGWEASCYTARGPSSLAATPFPSFEWKTNSQACYMADFDSERFCNLAGNRTFVFLGDSITWQHFNSLAYFLGGHPINGRGQQSSDLWLCGGSTNVFWRRDSNYRYLHSVLQQKEPEVLVLNRGAHYQPDHELIPEMNNTVEILHKWQENFCQHSAIDGKRRRCLLLFRETMPGHPHCSQHAEPVNNASEVEIAIQDRSFYVGNRANYRWHEFQHQNKLQEEALVAGGLRFATLGAYYVNRHRPDLHISAKDCLHYCLPGPPDVLNKLLVHELMRERDLYLRAHKRYNGRLQ